MLWSLNELIYVKHYCIDKKHYANVNYDDDNHDNDDGDSSGNDENDNMGKRYGRHKGGKIHRSQIIKGLF